jgi:hypothetical protein
MNDTVDPDTRGGDKLDRASAGTACTAASPLRTVTAECAGTTTANLRRDRCGQSSGTTGAQRVVHIPVAASTAGACQSASATTGGAAGAILSRLRRTRSASSGIGTGSVASKATTSVKGSIDGDGSEGRNDHGS